MSNERPVSLELHHEIEQFYFRESRTLDAYELREWLETMVDPSVRYRMVILEERFRKDRRPEANSEVPVFDDNYQVLGIRVAQFESGLQTMLDPMPRMRRSITNVSAWHGDAEGEYRVLSYGNTARFRRLYEAEQVIFSREDVLRRDAEGKLRIASRRIELAERVSRNKNLLFFL